MILIVGISFFYLTFNLPGSNTANSARVTIKFDSAKVRAFEGPVEGNMTVLQALLFASRGGDFDVRYFLSKDGNVNLASIGETVNGQKSWHFYLNGNPVKTEEIVKIKIKSGDLVEARYE